MIKLMVAGACGKMAGQIIKLAAHDKNFKVTGVFEAKGHPGIGKKLGVLLGIETLDIPLSADIEDVITQGDVLIDFTHREATPRHAQVCLAHKKGMVIGTTGLTDATLREIKTASKTIPVVQSPNMSAGVNLLFKLTELVAATLSDDYDIEIVESHHRDKKDAPSGTALELAKRASQGRKVDLEKIVLYGRQGLTGERKKGAIAIHAIRGGDVVGDHTVSFLTDGERIELTHRASSRDAFAHGALLAAKFVSAKKSGFFSMQDVLGL